MPPILSLLKYSYTNRRSPALNMFSILVAIWSAGWLVLWTLAVLWSEPEGGGGPIELIAGVCAWSVLVVAFCLVPMAVQIAWALRVQREEAAGIAPQWQQYAAMSAPLTPPPAYPPQYPAGLYPEPDRQLEEERRKTRELEYENALLKQRVRDEEKRRRSMTTVERLVEAQGLELERRYAEAAQAYEEMGRWEDASRVRTLDAKGGSR